MLYFAYGSNLNVRQMAHRCPDAVKVGRLILPDARLVFRGVADVIPSPGDRASGGLWEVTPACERALDRYEGCARDGSDAGLYRREFFRVLIRGEARDVLIYRMNSDDIFPPGAGYLDAIREGFRDFGLDQTPLRAAVEHARKAQRRGAGNWRLDYA